MRTLSIDIGASGTKAMVFDKYGKPLSERRRETTPTRATPSELVSLIVELSRKVAAPLTEIGRAREFERMSVGFPGVVVQGVVKNAPNLGKGWEGFELARELEFRLGAATRVVNDADLHGLAVIQGRGVELVLTLGTGVGSSLFAEGVCAHNLELGHHPYHKSGATYEERLGNGERQRIGNKRWRGRVQKAVALLMHTINPDRLYLGGGNAVHLNREDFDETVSVVDNIAGLVGGVKLWQRSSEVQF